MDEERLHYIGAMDEERLHYIGALILGLNDAIIEITGAIAGFTFALQSTTIIALADSSPELPELFPCLIKKEKCLKRGIKEVLTLVLDPPPHQVKQRR